MKQYQASYSCSCEGRQCLVTMQQDKDEIEPPPVCLFGKNVTNIITNGHPQWVLKGQRFKPDESQKG